MTCTKDELIALQEFLLNTFYTYDDVDSIQQQLNSFIQNPVLQAWSSTLNPDMLEVAARMVQHWGKKQ